MATRMLTLLAAAMLAGGSLASAAGGQERAVDGRELATAIFAGGCFWCVEEVFDEVDGVTETVSGYTGGTVPNPTYEQVVAGGTGHIEAVRVRYDPAKTSYAELLEVFWRNVDPFDAGGQFCDRGDSYLSAIFVMDDEQKRLAEKSKTEVSNRFERPVTTEIGPAVEFYRAEEYHQGYYLKNPIRYALYKWNCGRAQRLQELWGPAAKR